jgi:hypothetical protein
VIVLRCTAKLLARIGPPVVDPPQSTSVLGDWYAKPFAVAQRRFVLAMSAPSRLSIVLPGRDVRALPRTFADTIAQVLVELGLPPTAVAAEVDASREVVLAATNSKSALGSLNEFAFLAQYRLRVEPDEDLVRLAVWLSRVPVAAGGFGFPDDAVRRLLN